MAKRTTKPRAKKTALRLAPGIESPIEQWLYDCLANLLPVDFALTKQAWIDGYRVDFLVTGRGYRLVVEADGKAWHTKPEQVQADEKRESRIRALGYDIIRFTGSQIWQNPVLCASQVKRRLGVFHLFDEAIDGDTAKRRQQHSKRTNRRPARRIRPTPPPADMGAPPMPDLKRVAVPRTGSMSL